MKTEQYYKVDRDHLWHPFTQHTVWFEQGDPLVVERGEGVELIDIEGRRYLDGVSSLWCNVFGHNVPELNAALALQASKISHSTLLGLSHTAILELTEELRKILPPTIERFFYADSGAAAVEAALRMALEWHQRRETARSKRRTKYLSLFGSYHGDTLGAVNVGYISDFHQALDPVVVQAHRIPPPHEFRFNDSLSPSEAEDAAIAAMDSVFQRNGETLAACVVEPLVQGAAGIWVHSPRYLQAIQSRCERHEVLFIVDEVATGFGKTGSMLAIDQANVAPDIIVLGKSLSGGYLPISVAAAHTRIFEGFLGGPEEKKAFFYGQTFAGNPLAAAVSTANLRLLRSSGLVEQLPSKIELFQQKLQERIAPLRHVSEVRQQGVMVGIELCKHPGTREPFDAASRIPWKIISRARELGAFIRPIGNVLILMPALAMSESQLGTLVEITAEAITDVTERES